MLKNATNSASMQVIKIAGWPDVMAISSADICWYAITFCSYICKKIK